MLIDEKKEHECNVSRLEVKMRNKLMTSEEEIKCQKLEIEAGKTNLQQLVDNDNHVSGQLEDQLVKSEQEVKVLKRKSEAWKIRAENATNMLIDEKKEHEGNVSRLEVKMRNKLMTSEEEIKCQKLEIEAGKTNLQKLVDNDNHVSGQLEDQLVKSDKHVGKRETGT
eukprot:GFUD01038207.1.p1 GENE.GFUD01038207.1~~GFUD01038207.1.p1  ORF type:complete len:192 (+),score=66.68 GFUD01038207.1:76-576(+)